MILSKKRLTKQSNETKVQRFQNSKKGNKIKYEANNSIMEKIDKAIRAIEKGKIERCQEKLAEGKKIFLKQQKLSRIADMEEDEWEVVKFRRIQRKKNSSLELVGTQLQTKRKGKQISKKIKKKLFRNVEMSPLSEKIQSVLPVDKKDIFNISAQIEETETTVNSDSDWEISDKTEEISVRGRFKENSHFWKNELKKALLVQIVINNGYVIIPFIILSPSFCASNNKFSLRSSKFVSQTISKLLRNNCIEELDQKSYCCNPLTVAESKKLQIVLDLRHVNIFIKQNKFRYGKLITL